MAKRIPAKIWGCIYIGKIGRFYEYRAMLGYSPPFSSLKFRKFPTKESVRATFVNVVGFKYLVT